MNFTQHNRINWQVNEFCQAHGIGRTKFYALVKAGHIQILKCGTRTLIPASSAEAFQNTLELGNVR